MTDASARALWAVTAFFNPTNSPRLNANLRLFAERLRAQGVPLLVVELAFHTSPFRVAEGLADRVVQLRTRTVLWHKERLLNLGIARLPRECRYVAWLDGDVLFENENWVAETVRRLEDHAVVQPYDAACWLDEGRTTAPDDVPNGFADGHQLVGFAAGLERAPNRERALAYFTRHGHTGFAWAAQLDVIERHGLYDRAIVGGGDMICAHAFAADDAFMCGDNLYSRALTRAERECIAAWGSGVAAATGGRIGWTPGRVLHLFHGAIAQRGYAARLKILKDAAFDPLQDIAADAQGCWQWSSDKPELHRQVSGYFESRVRVSA